MQSKRPFLWPALAAAIGVFIIFLALPDSWKTWAPGFLQKPSFHFGLDLVGGTQLDFRISEQEMDNQMKRLQDEIDLLKSQNAGSEKIAILEQQLRSTEQQKTTIVESIRNVLERRINALGVSEAVITPSYMGTEKHLLVECPGVVDTQKCIATVGKTIQLEFKEEFTEATAEFEKSVRARADGALKRITVSGSTLSVVGQDLGSTLGVAYTDKQWLVKSALPKGIEDVWNQKPGTIVKREGSVTVPSQDQNGNPIEKMVPGIFLTEVLQPKTQTGHTVAEAPTAFALLAEGNKNRSYTPMLDVALDDPKVDPAVRTLIRSMTAGGMETTTLTDSSAALIFLRGLTPGEEQMAASHILITYAGASGAGKNVTRTKDQALATARKLKQEIDGGAVFAELAKKYSDDASNASNGGSLGTFGKGAMVPAFEEAAFALSTGSVSDSVETQFGYHLIRADQGVTKAADSASFDQLIVTTTPDALSEAKGLLGDLKAGRVKKFEDSIALRTLFFSLLPTGWKDTSLNGKHFRSAGVTLDPTSSLPIVQISFDDEGAKLFQELTKKNIGKRIAIFVGGDLVSAPMVQQEISGGNAIITGSGNFDEAQKLAQDLNTGAIPAPIYLSGQNTIEATLGGEALRTSLKAALIGVIILMLYMILIYRFLGFLADVALSIYALLFVAILKLPLLLFTSQYIVLTLAGMAGIILSIGMAVDANVLIFERIKEELRKGKLLSTAVNIGFKRAWPSIRDGNASTLLTCVVLFMIGTSIVRGFSVTLSMGVLMSMFTAITITRWLIDKTAHLPIAKNTYFLVGIRTENKPIEPFHA